MVDKGESHMKKHIIAAIAALLVPFTSLAGVNSLLSNYHVINRIHKDTVFHVESDSWLNGWSCGYFTLNNARTLDEVLGLGINDHFKQKCLPYMEQEALDPSEYTNDIDLLRMADDYLNMPDFYVLSIDSSSGRVEPAIAWEEVKTCFSTAIGSVSVGMDIDKYSIRIKANAPYRCNESDVMRVIDSERPRCLERFVGDIKSKLMKAGAHGNARAHFGCIFDEHIVLMSVVKFVGKSPVILIFDNLNTPIKPGDGAMKFVDYLHRRFCQ